MRLYLIRHGQSTANAEQYYAGQMDIPLTKKGQEDAMRIRPVLEAIPFDRVYCSDLQRAIDTQRIALPGTTAIRTPLLREYDMGTLCGVPFAEARAAYGTAFRSARDYSAFQGEDSHAVCKRIRSFLDLLESDPCGNIAAFAHNGIMDTMLQVVLNAQYDHTALGSKNCAIHVYEFDGKRWLLLAWNYMGTL